MDNVMLYLDFVNIFGRDKLVSDGKLTSFGSTMLCITAIKMANEFIDGVCSVLGVAKSDIDYNLNK